MDISRIKIHAQSWFTTLTVFKSLCAGEQKLISILKLAYFRLNPHRQKKPSRT